MCSWNPFLSAGEHVRTEALRPWPLGPAGESVLGQGGYQGPDALGLWLSSQWNRSPAHPPVSQVETLSPVRASVRGSFPSAELPAAPDWLWSPAHQERRRGPGSPSRATGVRPVVRLLGVGHLRSGGFRGNSPMRIMQSLPPCSRPSHQAQA